MQSPGHAIADGATQAANFVKEKSGMIGESSGSAGVRDHMPVIASCGKQVGVVDHVDGNTIKLARNGAGGDGQHHWIPLDWVVRVDEHVHLKKNSIEAIREWKSDAAFCSIPSA